MSADNHLEQLVVGRFLFPFTSFLFNRRHILSSYRGLSGSEFWDRERMRDLQLRRLAALLSYCDRHIPFYRERFSQAGLSVQDVRNVEVLRQVEPVTRNDVIHRHHDMVDSRFLAAAMKADSNGRGAGAPIPLAPFRKDRLVRNTSSGSTGAPTMFYEDGTRTALNWAHELRLRSWYGLPPGAREARMARVSNSYMPGATDLKFRKLLWNQLILPGVNLGPEDYQRAYEDLRNFRPRVLWGFTSALAGLAGYMDDNGLDPSLVRPELILTWAAPLYEHEERILKNVFGCPITNIYGAREVGHIAMRCPEGRFHINEENLLVEVEQGDGDKGEPYELLVTTLDTTVMPFIRYRMGDLGRLGHRDCPCGRTLLVLEELTGRTGEIFRTHDGRMISPNFWCRTFMNPALSGKIRRFQVVYRSDREIQVKLVKGPGFSEKTEQELLGFLSDNFSSAMHIYITHVDEIRPQVSGKYQMVINESDTGRQQGNQNS